MADPRHGTRRRYQTGCRCFPCRLADHHYRRDWQAGRKARVPSEPIRTHLQSLLDSGWTAVGVARVAGISTSTTWELLHQSRPSVNGRTARAIQAVQPLTDDGIRAHLRTLVQSGLTVDQIAADAQVCPETVQAHLDGTRHEVRHRVALALAEVEPKPAPLTLPAGPLLAAVEPYLHLLTKSERAAVRRVRRAGTVTEQMADRLSVAAGVGPLPLIYDLDDLEEAA